MLSRLLIQNYALIDSLEMQFSGGLNVITGETGAGKSIILEALSLALGQRADTASLGDREKKCVVEAEFRVSDYDLDDFFRENDLDHGDSCLVRREINVQGRSRAFINDTPVNVSVLKELAALLIDVHSQHQTVEFAKPVNQLEILDQVAHNRSLKIKYADAYTAFKVMERKLHDLLDAEANMKRDYDYYRFLFDELHGANLQQGESEELETEINRLSNAGDIKLWLAQAAGMMNEDPGLLSGLRDTVQLLEKASRHNPGAQVLTQRLNSLLIELRDIAHETEAEAERSVADPEKLHELENRLNLLNGLFLKHRVQKSEELIALMQDFETRVMAVENLDDEVAALRLATEKSRKQVVEIAAELTETRKQAAAVLIKEVKNILADLKMQGAVLEISLEVLSEPSSTGMDKALFMFGANKGSALQEIQKVASGGEFSRLMLAVKSVAGRKNKLPTVIFDEIDTGVSGEVAGKMGAVMHRLGETMQVFSITHLPQVAVKADKHYKVIKTEKKNKTFSGMLLLDDKAREEEIAKMLSGEKITNEALANARALMKTR